MQMEITLAKMIESRRFLTLMRCIKLFNAGKRLVTELSRLVTP